MRTIKLTLEYDGTEFAGWQYQTNGRTVQQALEEAAGSLLQEDVRVTGAGRTDAGVHARGQVCHFSTKNPMPVRDIHRGLNALLPEDVVVKGVEDAEDGFHARYWATSRTYTYSISQVPTAIGRRYSWFVGHPLDMDSMQRCAELIVGEHDFRSFCKADTNVGHLRCTVSRAMWGRTGSTVLFEISANRFLYGMVRALVGTMVDVGRGHISNDRFRLIMDSHDRNAASSSAPAAGLVLESVEYGPRRT